MRVKVTADYECWPLWWDEAGRVGNVSPTELGLSDHLSSDLLAWASAYDATLNRNVPSLSGFASDDEERLFHEQGRRLAARVADELESGATITHIPHDEKSDIRNISKDKRAGI